MIDFQMNTFYFMSFLFLFSLLFIFFFACLLLEAQGLREGHFRGTDGHHEASEHPVLQLQSDGCDVADLLRGHVWWWLLQQRHISWGYRGKWASLSTCYPESLKKNQSSWALQNFYFGFLSSSFTWFMAFIILNNSQVNLDWSSQILLIEWEMLFGQEIREQPSRPSHLLKAHLFILSHWQPLNFGWDLFKP